MSDSHLAPPPTATRTAHWSRQAAPAALAARCWTDACDEPLADGSEKWCAAHISSLAADVERAERWLSGEPEQQTVWEDE